MGTQRALQAAALLGIVLGAILSFPLLFVFVDAFGGTVKWWQSGPAGTWLSNNLEQLFDGLFGSVTNLYVLIGFTQMTAMYCAIITLMIMFVILAAILSSELKAHIAQSAERLRKVFSK